MTVTQNFIMWLFHAIVIVAPYDNGDFYFIPILRLVCAGLMPFLALKNQSKVFTVWSH